MIFQFSRLNFQKSYSYLIRFKGLLIIIFPIRYTKWQFYGYTIVYHGIPYVNRQTDKPTNHFIFRACQRDLMKNGRLAHLGNEVLPSGGVGNSQGIPLGNGMISYGDLQKWRKHSGKHQKQSELSACWWFQAVHFTSTVLFTIWGVPWPLCLWMPEVIS